jgi:hypothetical protein
MKNFIILIIFSLSLSLYSEGENFPFGMNHTVYYSFTEDTSINVSSYTHKYKETMGLAAQAHLRWWRAMGKFEWGSVQPDGPSSWDWADEDSLVKWAGKKGLHILAVLGCHRLTPEWASYTNMSYKDFGKCYPPDPNYWDDYHNFVKALVERYDGDGEGVTIEGQFIEEPAWLEIPIKYWEFSNEPDNERYFWGRPKQFIEMFDSTRKAIKKADPEAKIVGPCLTHDCKWQYYDIDSLKKRDTTFVDWMDKETYIINNIKIDNIDIISLHIYHHSHDTVVNCINQLRNTYGVDKPIWVTEWGNQNSDMLSVEYEEVEEKATCVYSALQEPFFGEVTAVWEQDYYKTLIDTFLYLGDTVRLYDRDTYQWDIWDNFQGGTITHKNGEIVLQQGDTVQINHQWLENIEHFDTSQARNYKELLYDGFDRDFLKNFKIFFYCMDKWVHNRHYPPEILFGDNKPIKLYRNRTKSKYTIINPEGIPPDGAYYVLNDYIEYISNIDIQDVTIKTSETEKYQAYDSIKVAGKSTYFIIEENGAANMEAGNVIHLKPEFRAEEGSYLHAYNNPSLKPNLDTLPIRNMSLTGALKPVKSQKKSLSSKKATKDSIPKVFSCAQNYPNPFASSTLIKYGLPKDVDVQLDIYNLLGQKVRTLVDAKQTAGYKAIKWDGRTSTGAKVPQGIYFYTFKASNFIKHRKMILVR